MDSCDDVIYCDTDCLVTPTVLPTDPTTLGALKLEAVITEGQWLAPKRYWYIDAEGIEHRAFKGVSGGDPRVDKQEFVRITQAREAWRRGLVAGAPMSVTKNHALNDNKRHWNHDCTSDPLFIDSNEITDKMRTASEDYLDTLSHLTPDTIETADIADVNPHRKGSKAWARQIERQIRSQQKMYP